MDFADYLVIDDPLSFCNFLEGEFSANVFGFGSNSFFWFHWVRFSYLGFNFSCLDAFAFPDFGGCVGVWVDCSCKRFLLACIACLFFSTRVYLVPFRFLWWVKFIQFFWMSLVGSLVWCEGSGVGLKIYIYDLSNVY